MIDLDVWQSQAAKLFYAWEYFGLQKHVLLTSAAVV